MCITSTGRGLPNSSRLNPAGATVLEKWSARFLVPNLFDVKLMFLCFVFLKKKNPTNLCERSRICKTHLFAYAQILSIRGQFFKAASTLPRETYSPACNFTKSFLRSGETTKQSLGFERTVLLRRNTPYLRRHPLGSDKPAFPRHSILRDHDASSHAKPTAEMTSFTFANVCFKKRRPFTQTRQLVLDGCEVYNSQHAWKSLLI